MRRLGNTLLAGLPALLPGSVWASFAGTSQDAVSSGYFLLDYIQFVRWVEDHPLPGLLTVLVIALIVYVLIILQKEEES